MNMIVTPLTCGMNIKSEVVSVRVFTPAPVYIPQVFRPAVYEPVCDFRVRGPPGFVNGLAVNASVESICARGAS
jgi:hypothetical protein